MSLQYLRPEVRQLEMKLQKFVKEYCEPAEVEYERHMETRFGKERWTRNAVPPCVGALKKKAQELGLWNLFLSTHPISASLLNLLSPEVATKIVPSQYLSTREYGVLCELMGRSFLAPEACNCSAPDTGNMEVLLKHGTTEQQLQYLVPLLEGRIRSCFLMTEPDVASSDALNIQTKLTKVIAEDGSSVQYVLNGRKWWSTGAMDPRCEVALVLAKMDYSKLPLDSQATSASNHNGHTVVIVPMKHAGVKLIRPLTVLGFDDAPSGHAEVELSDVVLDESALIIGEGSGFLIAQSRLGPGRIHHCMRAVGLAARCYELMLQRSMTRQAFGKALCDHGGCQDMIADSAADIEASRLLTLNCAAAIDELGSHGARDKIAMIKVSVPQMTLRVVDRAVQVFGGAGLGNDFPLARALAGLRALRIADGPDAVHRRTVARLELKKAIKRSKL